VSAPANASVEADARRVLGVIRKRPGVRAVEIAEALGLTTRDVSDVLRALKRARAVKRRGNTRATTYTVAT